MSQITVKIESKSPVWASWKRFRVGASAKHNGVVYVNVTGRNTEPGVGDDWIKIGSEAAILELENTLTSTAPGRALDSRQGPVITGLIEANTVKFADYILLSEKGAANGVAVLDSNGKIVSSQYGDLAVTDTIQATETALSAFTTNNANYTFQQGDIIVLATDLDGNIAHYLFKGGDKSLEVNYSKLNATKIPISSVIGLQNELDGKEPAFLKNEAFNSNFGYTGNDVLRGTDVKLEPLQTPQGIFSSTGGLWTLDYTSSRPKLLSNFYAGLNRIQIDDSFNNTQYFLFRETRNEEIELINTPTNEFFFPDGKTNVVKGKGTIIVTQAATYSGIKRWYVSGDLVDSEVLSELRSSKPISNTTQYTLAAEDAKKHLVIANPIDIIVPANVFIADQEIQFKNDSGGDVNMIESSGVTLEVIATQQKTVPSKGFGGMRFESATKAGVFGQLKPIL